MEWIIEFDEEFSTCFDSQEDNLKDEMLAVLKVLAELGPYLRRLRVGSIVESRHSEMKELVVQYKGEPGEYFLLLIRCAMQFAHRGQ